jgi:cell wall assembly regulator SMI1
MKLVQSLQSFLDNVKLTGADVRDIRVDPPASEDEIQQIERELGITIPSELRNTMLQVSSHLEFKWFLNDDFELPQELRAIFCGEIHWGLDLTANLIGEYKGWISSVFSNPEDPYDVVWHDKFPFQEVGNGDVLSIDRDGQVVYLSHDDGEGHGYVMAESFDDLLSRWVPLGCVGGEDWQWMPFTNGMTTMIDPQCEAALTWKSLIDRREGLTGDTRLLKPLS